MVDPSLVSAIGTVIMTLVWLCYLQLFLQDFRKRRQPRLLIQQSDAPAPRHHCTLVNMSDRHVDVLAVLVVAHLEDGERARQLRQAEHENETHTPHHSSRPAPPHVKAGPLQPGEYLLLGTFRELIDWVTVGDAGAEGEQPSFLEIRALFFHGVDDRPLGSHRTFRITYDEHNCARMITPTTLHTPHLRKRRHRHQVEEWYQQILKQA